MQRAHYLGTHAPRTAGDQYDLIAQRKIVIHGHHARQQYPKTRGSAK
ncbi:MAG TPA: hypothetical protein VII41_06210 [Steroidobacteraceae bacterium]